MNPYVLTGLLMLAALLGLALVGIVLIRMRILRARHAAHYTRFSTVLVLGLFYASKQYAWFGLHLRTLDYWSLMVILAIAGYALVWAAIAYQLNQMDEPHFAESYMLSMLYSDSQQMDPVDFEPTQRPEQHKK